MTERRPTPRLLWPVWLTVLVVVAVVAGLVLGPVWGASMATLGVLATLVLAVLRRWSRLGALPAALAAAVVALLAAQLVPFGRSHDNPAPVQEPVWDSPQTRALAVAACFDCHSNETEWPWYTSIAPASWVTQRHVEEGREKLNFSRFDLRQEEADEAAETVEEGSMPLLDYTLIHPAARLSDQDRIRLATGLRATLGGEGGGDGDSEQDDD